MRCASCGRYGIRWMGPLSDLTHTECPHCGGINCQEPDESYRDDLTDADDDGLEAWLGDR
jgi:hypothetical protein